MNEIRWWRAAQSDAALYSEKIIRVIQRRLGRKVDGRGTLKARARDEIEVHLDMGVPGRYNLAAHLDKDGEIIADFTANWAAPDDELDELLAQYKD